MTDVARLDELPPAEASVGWGVLGAGGRLGYEGKNVVVGGRRYAHALSTHPPARVAYALDGGPARFRCAVALNDDVAESGAEADFTVLADGAVVAAAHARAGEPPQALDVQVADAAALELVVGSPGFANCHAVWLDPRLEPAAPARTRRVPDCLGALSLRPPPQLAAAERCLLTLAVPGGAAALDDLLGSFLANAGCPDARLVVLLAGEDDECVRVAAKYGALAVDGRLRRDAKPPGLASLATLARHVPAERYLCLAPGALVAGDLRPVFAALDVCPEDAVLAAGDAAFAGRAPAVAQLERAVRSLARPSLAAGLRRAGTQVALDLSSRIVAPEAPHADRGSYAAVADPLPGGGAGDAYVAFADTLRGWVGRHGVGVLSWSFYGTQDGMGGRVRDPSTFPLLGLLHYLVRSSGCARVLETGTAKGVTAACLASAVAHRRDARVVTVDLAGESLRESLWSRLPEPMRACIEERRADSVEEMRRAFAAGERYDAALLDTDHSAGHVWREFDIARRLVRPGGPILVHDPGWEPGSVEDALERIAAEGYGVVRLWNVDGLPSEDDGLGLALVENRERR